MFGHYDYSSYLCTQINSNVLHLDGRKRRYGKVYANFYGGILIRSEHLNDVLERLSAIVKEVGLENEEIKWQKVNEFAEERYKKIIDVLFALLPEDKAKIRIFFRHRQYEAVGLTNELRRKEYPMLYYQFIKNDSGLIFSKPSNKEVRVRLLLTTCH